MHSAAAALQGQGALLLSYGSYLVKTTVLWFLRAEVLFDVSDALAPSGRRFSHGWLSWKEYLTINPA